MRPRRRPLRAENVRVGSREGVGGGYGGPLNIVSAFGQQRYGGGSGQVPPTRAGRGPTLRITFTPQGGGLYVRDYPDVVEPRDEVDWPGYEVSLEPRPAVAGLSKRRARYRLERWRERRAEQLRSQRRVDRLLPGPCGSEAKAKR